MNKKLLIAGFFIAFALYSPCLYASGLADIETALVQQDFEKAQQLADKFTADHSDSPLIDEAYYFLGMSHLGLSEYEQARDIFSLLAPKQLPATLRDKVYLGLVDSYFFLEEYKKALDAVEKLQKINSKSEFLSLIYLKKARAHLKLTHWAEANKYLKKIVADFPDSFEFHLARQLLEEKRYFSVQVGSFIERGRAESLVNELRSKSEYAYIVETIDREGKAFFRVRVGELSKLEEAQKLRIRLSKFGYPTQIYP